MTQLTEGVDYFTGDFDGDGKVDFLLRGQSLAEYGGPTEYPYIVYAVDQLSVPSGITHLVDVSSDVSELVAQGSSFSIRDVNGDGADDLVFGSGNAYIADKAYLSTGGVPQNPLDLTVPETQHANLTGKTETISSVTAGGAASISVPLQLPEGSGGLAPELALNYSSQAGNGLMGFGWTMPGLSVIQNCYRTYVHDGSGSVNSDDKDRFCVDGQRLVAVSGTYGALNSTYRTEINTFREYTLVNDSSGDTGFTVSSKDGKQATYTQMGPDTYVLTQLKDSSGNNKIVYSYLDDSNGLRIDKIEYAYGSGTTPNAMVDFVYESRPDALAGNLVPGEMDLKRRLKRIDITSLDSEYRSYSVNYLKQPDDGSVLVSRVASLQECVGSSCLPALSFEWEIADNPGFSSVVDTSKYVEFHHTNNSRFQPDSVADVNGDGKDDYLWYYKDDEGRRYFQIAFSDGQKWVRSATNYTVRSYSAARNDWHLVDYNGDGKLDLLHRTEDYGWVVRLFNTSTNHFSGTSIGTGIPSSAGNQTVLTDVTGDGWADLVMRHEDSQGMSIYYAEPNPSGGFKFPSTPDRTLEFNGLFSSCGSGDATYEILDLHAMRVLDEDGDGRTEFLYPVKEQCSNGIRKYFWGKSDSSSSRLSSSGVDLGDGVGQYQWIPADLNRDGLTDRVRKDDENNWSYALSVDGIVSSYTSLGEKSSRAELVDYNHDGYLDFIWPGSSTLKVKLWNGSGFDSEAIDAGVPSSTEDFIHPVFADINGDGYREYIYVYDGGQQNPHAQIYASRESSTPNNVISKVTGAYGEQATFTYKPLTDSSVYTKGSNAGSVDWGTPVFDITGSSYVVSKYEFSMPTAASATNLEALTYQYEGLKFQGGGRGSLGFAKVTTTDARVGKTVSTFKQEFPYSFMPLTVEQYSRESKLLSRQTNTLASKSSGGVYWPYVETSTTDYYLLKNNGASAGALYKKLSVNNDYDDYGNLELSTTEIRNAANVLVSTVTQDNCFSCYSAPAWFREQGRVARTSVTSTRGNESVQRVVRFDYFTSGSKQGLLQNEIIEPDYTGADADDLRLTTSYGYDDFGNRLSTTKTAANEPSRGSSSEYDALKRYIDIVRDADGRKLTEVIARNVMGLPTEVRRYTNVSGSAYVTTNFEYDVLGRETYRDPGDGPWVKTEYRNCSGCGVTGAAYYTEVTSETGAKSSSYYDLLGQVLRTEQLGLDTSDVIQVQTEYDDLGRVERQSEPYNRGSLPQYWTQNSYDIQSRLTSVLLPDSGTIVHTEPVLESNLIVAVTTNQKGQTRTEKTNVLGEPVYVVDHKGGTVEYQYTASGQVEHVISQGRAGENLGITITTRYDRRGRKESMSDPDKGNWSYRYNGFDDLVEQTDGKQQRTETQYDRYGRPLRRTDWTAVGTVDYHTRWYYDDQDAGGTSVPYALGQVTSVVHSRSANDELCYDATAEYCALYSYDSAGRQRSMSSVLGVGGADGDFIRQTEYDSLGRPYKQFDALDGVVTSGGSAITSGTRQYYTNSGHLSYVVDLNSGNELYRVIDTNSRGQVTDYDVVSGAVRVDHNFDPATGRLLSQKADNATTTVQQMAYGWDILGNLTSRNNQRSGQSESFCYDHLNRLLQVNPDTTSVTGCNPDATSTQYRYDSIGNVTHKDGQAYVYGSSKPHAVTQVGSSSYVYADNNGNLTSDSTGRLFNYTTFDKPSLISSASGDSTAFDYGPDRARYKRVDTRAGGEVITTLYLGAVELIKRSSESTVKWKRYLPGDAVFTYTTNAANEQQNLDKRYLLKDHIGSTDVVLDGSGASISGEGMSFDPWGQRRDSSWQQIDISALVATDYSLLDTLTDTTTRGFTGHEMVDALGIIHMNGRVYDPALGRFLQADPMIDGAMDTQGYNRYSYVKGNPLTLTDPTGYYSWGDFRKDWKEFWKDRSVGVSVGSNGVGVYGGDPNPDSQGFWAPAGGAGAALPEGSSSGAFRSANSEGISALAYASSGTIYNGGGYDAVVAEETLGYFDVGQGDFGSVLRVSEFSEDAFLLASNDDSVTMAAALASERRKNAQKGREHYMKYGVYPRVNGKRQAPSTWDKLVHGWRVKSEVEVLGETAQFMRDNPDFVNGVKLTVDVATVPFKIVRLAADSHVVIESSVAGYNGAYGDAAIGLISLAAGSGATHFLKNFNIKDNVVLDTSGLITSKATEATLQQDCFSCVK
ncbi:FG-GAP-like repeat-containing protein [Microbulbifer sp. TYP-18]|uniref:FG-GAP-like repeat-containing protein n=1 Tax=Microbulbifer sp. TYP-18 TaxID=3230024 RepID=UPI0034C69763